MNVWHNMLMCDNIIVLRLSKITMIVVQFNAAFFGKGRSNITSNASNNNSLEKLAFMRLYRIVKYVHAIYMHI